MANLTEQIGNTNGRTTALENDRLRNQKEISRITKIYGGLKITSVVTYNLHTYLVCGAPNVICGAPNTIL